MSNTTKVQYTHTHSTTHMSQQHSDVIPIMKMIRNQIEDDLHNHISQELQVGIIQKKQSS